ncbi:class I SAM-dependent RNA methyltransferase [Corynebacterium sp. BF-R-2]|uniref:class I SAM-dependent RNA methyltransferase n=1 Tax=Corynebacterium sp. BF-R-2 TaxID=2943494 RepID=UPI00211DE27E|nr:TRAM domain-containing protein [Corynebacterium sp. BF-R-2]MCQ9676188.1 TRAM domain-containing protein [Corynebacterium sp. BF-R-2]
MSETEAAVNVSTGESFDISIERMAHGGVGIGSAPDGRVCFVAGGFPGDLLTVTARKVKKSFVEADLTAVVKPGPHRVESSCPAAERGAGCCDFAELDPAVEPEIKVEVLLDQLRRVARIETTPEVDSIDLEPQRGWRTRVRLGVDKHGRAGTRKRGSTELITDVACTQLAEGLVDGLVGPNARTFTPGAEVIAVIDSDGNRHVVESRKASRGRRVETVREVIEAPTADVVQRADGHEFRFPPTAFWQAHVAAPDMYTRIAREWLAAEDTDAANTGQCAAWDLYGGVGLFVPALAEVTAPKGGHTTVYSVDYSPSASGTQQGLDGIDVEFRTAKVEQVADQLPQPTTVVLDPPRTGAGADVITAVASASPRKVVHVGCDPATFARDLAYWSERGYHLHRLAMINAFPGTHHFETLALLVPQA